MRKFKLSKVHFSVQTSSDWRVYAVRIKLLPLAPTLDSKMYAGFCALAGALDWKLIALAFDMPNKPSRSGCVAMNDTYSYPVASSTHALYSSDKNAASSTVFAFKI